MTPAELARQIDKEEFAAECAAVRQRAFVFLAQRHHAELARTALWLGREAPAAKFNPVFTLKPKKVVAPKESKPRATAHRFTHDGQTLTLKEWAAITGISAMSLRSRITNGWTIHDALTVPVKPVGKRMHRGVSFNFAPFEGTGAGSTAQENPNITFSGNDA
ncbi:hypothetical protein HB774_09945 [Rhizobium leguminosarum bv. viciae]|nr:hypothetical protein HB774_09945 [Rhizobium leguminosarum bv. viciae]